MHSKLKFSANLKWLFTELPFEQRYDAAAAAGFKAVEFPWPYSWPLAEVRKLLDNSGLKQLLINTPVGQPGTVKSSGQACHPDSVAAFRADFASALEYASGLACEFIHLQGGIKQPEVADAQAFETLVNNVSWAAEQASGSGVTLVLEAVNHYDLPGSLLTTQARSLQVIEAASVTNVGLLFDIYHTQRSEGDVSAKMRQYFPYIKHVQVADSPNRNEPGTGELNWRYIFGELIGLGYQGWVGCEYRPVTTTGDGLVWLDQRA